MRAASLTFAILTVAAMQCAAAAPTTTPATLPAILPLGEAPAPVIRVNKTPARTVQLLAEAMGRTDLATARARLIGDLAETRRAQAIAPVRQATKDRDPLVRAAAARALGQLWSEASLRSQLTEAAEQLKALLGDESATVRREAALAAGAMGQSELVKLALKDADSGVFVAACSVASAPDHADAIAARLSSLGPTAQRQGVLALGRMKSARHADAVAGLLKAPLPVKLAAVEALGQMRAAGHADAALALLAASEHPAIRRAATLALRGLCDESVRNARGLAMLGDSDPTVRQAAAELLGTAPSPQAAEALVRQLGDFYAPLHDAAREALVACGRDAVPHIVNLLKDPHPRARENASYVLGQWRSPEALADHIELLKESAADAPNWSLVAQAARSLGRIGDASAGPAVAEALRDVRKPARGMQAPAAAARAFIDLAVAAGKLKERSALAVLTPIMGNRLNEAVDIRCAAIWAFCLLADDVTAAKSGSRLLAIYHDPEDMDEVKLEALKALGHLRRAEHLAALRRIEAEDPSPAFRWMAHYAADRIEGHSTAYTPPPQGWIADTSIVDLSRSR